MANQIIETVTDETLSSAHGGVHTNLERIRRTDTETAPGCWWPATAPRIFLGPPEFAGI